MMALYTLIMSVIGGGTSANQQDLDTLQQAAGPTYNVMVVFVGPVCEELIFRGFAINIFFNNKSRWVKWIAIVASGFAGYAVAKIFAVCIAHIKKSSRSENGSILSAKRAVVKELDMV